MTYSRFSSKHCLMSFSGYIFSGLPNGDWEVGVHIADVTFFLQQNSALDKDAASRATTFYLSDRRFDMLPRLVDGITISVVHS